MAEESDQEKTEEATQQRREDYRNRGHVAQTRELSSVFVLLGAALGIWLLGRFFISQITGIFDLSFTTLLVQAARWDDWRSSLYMATERTALLLGPLLGIAWLAALSSNVVQIGLLYNEEALKFDVSRIDPIAGFKRVFSLRGVVEGIKAVFKLVLIGAVAYYLVRGELDQLPVLSKFSIEQMMTFIGSLLVKLLASVGVVMLFLSAFDYFYQRWELEKQMMMTKQEVKEEIKSREGDPLIRARIRRVQREMANKRMMEDVPKADVVITNPTHIAVALQYTKEMVAPKIIAKGAGVIAEKIKEIARSNRVPVVENKPLARTIFKTLDIGQMIPRELYTAVAEVLIYVFKLKKKARV